MSDFIFRKIYKQTEIEEFDRISAFSFSIKNDNQSNYLKRHMKIFDDGREFFISEKSGKITSGFINFDYQMKMGEKYFRTGGVGDVCSLSSSRGSGGINFLFEEYLNYLYDNNYTFSILNPFSYRFYRKYGYELFADIKKLNIDTGAIKKIIPDKHITAEESDFNEDINNYFNSYNFLYNNFVMRDKKEWDHNLFMFGNNEVKRGIIKFSSEGKITGLLSYIYTYEGDRKIFTVPLFIYSNFDTQTAMMNYLKGLSYQINELIISVSDSHRLWLNLDEGYRLRPFYTILLRVIKPENIKNMKINCEKDFSVNIEIEDRNISGNNAVWNLECIKGILNINKSSGKNDFKTDINSFSSLISGYSDFTELVYGRKIIKTGNKDIPDIKKRNNYFCDFF